MKIVKKMRKSKRMLAMKELSHCKTRGVHLLRRRKRRRRRTLESQESVTTSQASSEARKTNLRERRRANSLLTLPLNRPQMTFKGARRIKLLGIQIPSDRVASRQSTNMVTYLKSSLIILKTSCAPTPSKKARVLSWRPASSRTSSSVTLRLSRRISPIWCLRQS